MKKLISIILALAICLSVVSASALSTNDDVKTESKITDWFINLYISICETFDSIFEDIDTTTKFNLKCDGKAIRFGTWLWDTTDVDTMGDEYLAFLKKNSINEIYLFCEGIGYNVTEQQVKKFVKKANQNGIRCAFMGGEYCWLDSTDTSFDDMIKKFENYQANAAEDEKFYGIHLDLEPAQHPDYINDSQGVMQKFADFLINKARPAADKNNTVLEWDIHRFLDEFTVTVKGEQINLLELFIRECDTILLMSYSDEVHGMFKWTTEEFEYAKKYKTPIFMAAETGTVCGDGETYAQEGQRVMVRNLNKVNKQLQEQFEYGEYGIAVHHVSSWYKLQNYRLPSSYVGAR